MTIFLDGAPADYEHQVRPFLAWLQMTAWLGTDGEDKINAARAIGEVWELAEAQIQKIIIYHGLADQLIPAAGTVYY